jgi:hypothetical protein
MSLPFPPTFGKNQCIILVLMSFASRQEMEDINNRNTILMLSWRSSKSIENEFKHLQKQYKAGPIKDSVRSPPFSSGKKFKSASPPARRGGFDPPRHGKQVVSESSYYDKDSVATDSTMSSRKRFIAPWTRVGVRYHAEHSQLRIASTNLGLDGYGLRGKLPGRWASSI